ncbi:hypothetical protein M885DRAFT_482537 [Pelagophyceae sp. CCMP2097]|nr:hypothetical protein M885DRAFT_482537 [Pelagophyceae sp. CCMP2097]|mmetsp:Transcript_2385/g.8632  ORF Transcript_2385/g.8632 Transcript_2385/m.8632 type:complete len:1045 (-) Transcript_2385:176-3310(-)
MCAGPGARAPKLSSVHDEASCEASAAIAAAAAPAHWEAARNAPRGCAGLVDRFIDWFTLCIVRRPVAILAGCVLTVALSILALVLSGWSTTPQTSYDWLLQWDRYTINADMIADAATRVDSVKLLPRGDETYRWYFAYDAESPERRRTCSAPFGVLDARNVQVICQTERELLAFGPYLENFSVLVDGVHRQPPHTALSYIFYGDEMTDPDFENPCALLDDDVLAENWQKFEDGRAASYLVDSGAFDRGYACQARSVVAFGTPLSGHDEVGEQFTGRQFERVKSDLIVKVEERLNEKYGLEEAFMRSRYLEDEPRLGAAGKRIDVMWYSQMLQNLEWARTLKSDTLVAGFSILFVLLWLCAHTGSAFVGCLTMAQIIASLPLATFLYSVVLRISFFSTLQTLVIFIVLGIGADDVFVFSDAWYQSQAEVSRGDLGDEEYLHKRLKYAYTRAIMAIFNTSFTTTAAFCATCWNRVMPIQTFGAFAALCVITNYLLAITMTPAIFLAYQQHVLHASPLKRLSGCGLRTAENAEAAKEIESDVALDAVATDSPASQNSRLVESYLWLVRWRPEATVPAGARLRALRTKPVAIVLVAAFGAVGILAAVQASKLTPPDKPEVWFSPLHMFQRYSTLSSDDFSSKEAAAYPTLSFVWGMKHLKRPDFDDFDPGMHRGDVVFSHGEIDLSDADTASSMRTACALVRDWRCGDCEGGDRLFRPVTTLCFVEEFEDWLLETHNETLLEARQPQLDGRLALFRNSTTPKSALYSSWKEYVGLVDGSLKFVRVDAKLLVSEESGMLVKQRILKRVNMLRSALRIQAPALPDSLFHTSRIWVWYKLQNALIQGMLQGMALTFPIAALALVGATGNTTLSAFAVVTIGFIVAAVLGLAQVLGWFLGIKESIAAVLVIGLAVDYTLHLGHMYEHANHAQHLKDREARFVSAARSMGVTVLAGAATTAGSGGLMYACQSIFFTQMATLIVATILFSLAFSIFFFMPLLYVAGPEHDQGNVGAGSRVVYDMISPSGKRSPRGGKFFKDTAAAESKQDPEVQ